MLKLATQTLVVVRWEANRGRSYAHTRNTGVCLACEGEPLYSLACEQLGHKRRREVNTVVTEADPKESKAIQRLYHRLYDAFRKIGYACGDQVYLLGKTAPLDEAIAELRELFDEANKVFKHCKADFRLSVIQIVPDEAHAETMRSLERDVSEAVDRLLDALASCDPRELRKALRETRNVSALLAGEASSTTSELTDFAAKMVKRFKEIEREGEGALALAEGEAREGARRFETLWSGICEENQEVVSSAAGA